MTYTYGEHDSDRLVIEKSNQSSATAYLRSVNGTFIPAADLPKIFAELRKAAGVPARVEHEHEDDEGAALSILSSEFRPNTAFVEGCNGVYVTPEDLPGLVRKLYEAAGQELPIILPRANNDTIRAEGWISGRFVMGPRTYQPTYTPEQAREEAARLAAAADLAESEPSAEQVKQLADLIEEQAGWLRHPAELAAKAVLRAGYERGES